MRAVRTLGRRLILSSAVSLTLLLGAELGLRVAGVQPFPDWRLRHLHVPDQELGVVPAPDFEGRQEGSGFSVSVRTSSLGLRSGELPDAPGEVVLLLGDSVAFGHGIEQGETVADRLQERLSTGENTTTVLNGGVSSYGTFQAGARLRKLAGAVRPDACVLLFFTANDPYDNLKPAMDVSHGWMVSPGTELSFWDRSRLRLKYGSSLYRALAELVHEPEIDRCGAHPAFGIDIARREMGPREERAWSATREALAALRQAASEAGCELHLLIVPGRFQVSPAWWNDHVQACALDANEYDLDAPQQHTRELCDELDIPWTDATGQLRAAAHEGPVYFDEDLMEAHPNARGHAVLAEVIADLLTGRR